jgi:hypothetical protein
MGLVYDPSMKLLFLLIAAAQPVKDPASVDVCKKVPGAEVAGLFGKALKEAKPFVSKGEFSRCTYLVGNPGSSDTVPGYSLWLYSAGEYDELLEYTEGIVDLPASGTPPFSSGTKTGSSSCGSSSATSSPFRSEHPTRTKRRSSPGSLSTGFASLFG